MKFRKPIKIFLIILAVISGLILMLITLINTPPGHRFITKKVNGIISSSGLPVHIREISRINSRSISVEGVTVMENNGDTIAFAGEIRADIVPLELLRKRITISSIQLSNTKINIRRENSGMNITKVFSSGDKDTLPAEPDQKAWEVLIHRTAIKNLNFQMKDSLSGIYVNEKIANVNVEINNMSLPDHFILMRKVEISGIEGSIRSTSHPLEKDTASTGGFPWNISLSRLDLDNINQDFSSDSIPAIGIHDLLLSVSDLRFTREEKNLVIDKTSFTLDNGFAINEMKGDYNSKDNITSLNLSVKTGNSQFNIESRVSGDIIDMLSDPSTIKDAAITVNNTEVSLQDLFYFKTTLKKDRLFTALGKSPFIINVNLNIKDSILKISEINIQKDKIKLLMSGNIKNAFIKDRQSGNLKIEIPEMNIEDLKAILEGSSLQKDIPDIKKLSLTASLEGSMKAADFTVGFTGDLGEATVKGNLDYENDKFYAKSVFNDILPGKMLRDSTYGPVYGNIEINGKGLRHKNLAADVVAIIDSAEIKGYNYSGARLELNINNNQYYARFKITDQDIKCDLEASMNLTGSIIEINSAGSFQAKLNELKLLKDTLQIEGNMKVSFRKERKLIASDLTLSSMKFSNQRENFILPETKASFSSDTINSLLDASSDFFNIHAEIEKPFSDLSQVISGYKDYAESFIVSSIQKRIDRTSYLPGLRASVTIQPSRAFNIIMNDTTFHFKNFEINAVNDPGAEIINYTVNGRSLKYKGNSVSDFYAILTDSSAIMHLDINAENCMILSKHIDNVTIHNSFINKWGTTNISIFEAPGKLLYKAEIIEVPDSSELIVSVPSHKMIIDSVEWTMDSPELMRYNRSSKAITASFNMTNGNSGITMNSVINAGKKQINAGFTNFDLKIFKPFVQKYVSGLEGRLSGNVKALISDKIDNLDGELNFNKVQFRIDTLNSLFKIPFERLAFTGEKIVFDSFKILDSLDNELLINGSVDLGSTIMSNLEISSSNLKIMGNSEKENPAFYGDIYVDTRLSVSGPVSNPDIKGSIRLIKGTELFFRETENLNMTETSKILIFTSPEGNQKHKPQTVKTINPGNSINADIHIDPETKINFSLSKSLFNVDLAIQGGGDLNYNVNASKEPVLSGKYEVSEGTTNVKITGWSNKSFTIKKGGYISWDGRLDDPVLNLQAINTVHSSYLNPVDNKEHEADIDVTLNLANRLSSLDLLFTINTSDPYLTTIINTLSPEEQMRQAITTLLFSKVDLPGISTSPDYVTKQVNQLVASQLNQLTKTTISGIDISFGINSYVQGTEAGGRETKTSLSYDLKKSLFNKRAQIEVSGSLNDVNKQPGSSDLSLNNVSFEYRLDPQGTKFLKVYNEHSFENVFEGEIVITGIGLTFKKSYPKLGDIWKKRKK